MCEQIKRQSEHENKTASIRIIDGGGLTMTNLYTLIRDDLAESVSRSSHIGALNTITTAQINGSDSLESNTFSFLPKVILHEFQPGRTNEDDYPIHEFPLPDGNKITLTETEIDSPGLYFNWKTGARELLVDAGFDNAFDYASPAQFYLHTTLTPHGERFMTMSEYLLSEDHLDVKDLLDVAVEAMPEVFTKAFDQAGCTYDLVEVDKDNLTYHQKADETKTMTVPRNRISELSYQYLETAKLAAENPNTHIKDIQNDIGIVPDAIFLTTAIAIKESLETNSEVVYHVSGTQMHRYLIQSDSAARQRQEQVTNLYNEFVERTNNHRLKNKLNFVIIPVSSIAKYTVQLEEAAEFSNAVDILLEIENSKKKLESEEERLTAEHKKEVSSNITGLELSEIEAVVRSKYEEVPTALINSVVSSYPQRMRSELSRAIVSLYRSKKEQSYEKEVLSDLVDLSEAEVIAKIKEKHLNNVSDTEAQRGFENIPKQLKPKCLKIFKTLISNLAIQEELEKMGFNDDNSPEDEDVHTASSKIPTNVNYRKRFELFNQIVDSETWLDDFQKTMPELDPLTVASTVQQELHNNVISQVAHKAASKMAKNDKDVMKLSQQLPNELKEVGDNNLRQHLVDRFGDEVKPKIDDVLESFEEGLVKTLINGIVNFYVARNQELQKYKEEFNEIVLANKEKLLYILNKLSEPQREINQYDGQLYIHPVALTTAFRDMETMIYNHVQICKLPEKLEKKKKKK